MKLTILVFLSLLTKHCIGQFIESHPYLEIGSFGNYSNTDQDCNTLICGLPNYKDDSLTYEYFPRSDRADLLFFYSKRQSKRCQDYRFL